MEQTHISFKKMGKVKLKKRAQKIKVVDPETDRRIITYTWCECGENHAGGAQEGEKAEPGGGFNEEDLKQAVVVGKKLWGCQGELHNLKKGIEGS